MQLVAYGAQDIYLTGNPQITFFKVVYRRHTNFSIEAIEQTWNGTSSSNGRCTSTISRNGDLVHRMYIEVKGNVDTNEGLANPGVGWIKNIELEIGGQKIDEHSGVWMETWAELTEKNTSSVTGLLSLTGNKKSVNASGSTLFQNMSGYGGISTGQRPEGEAEEGGEIYEPPTNKDNDMIFTVPLQFWFCRNVGLALPLIALQYHEVKVILEHSIENYFSKVEGQTLYADYIYLDTDERRRFAQVSHEYLIEQVQEQQLSAGASNQLNFNHPVKELIWTSTNALPGEKQACSLHSPCPIGTGFTLQLNGHERFSSRESTYFSRTQIYEHHTGPGGLFSELSVRGNSLDFAMALGAVADFSNSSEYGADSASTLVEDELGATRILGRDLAADDGSDQLARGKLFENVTLKNRFRYAQKGMTNDAICVYSFALKPEEHQPSGTCNFSRIDNAQLIGAIGANKRGPGAFKKRGLIYDQDKLIEEVGEQGQYHFVDGINLTNHEAFLTYHNSEDAGKVDSNNNTSRPVIFAVNYNVLRIMSGMGGLAYSN